jgi:hypothetical protein
MLSRGGYAAYYKCDHSSFDVIFGEPVLYERPEDVAKEVRKYFEEG